ncbi:MAG: hypothetical protein WBQ36_14435 [Desulfobaccales bacterium]
MRRQTESCFDHRIHSGCSGAPGADLSKGQFINRISWQRPGVGLALKKKIGELVSSFNSIYAFLTRSVICVGSILEYFFIFEMFSKMY